MNSTLPAFAGWSFLDEVGWMKLAEWSLLDVIRKVEKVGKVCQKQLMQNILQKNPLRFSGDSQERCLWHPDNLNGYISDTQNNFWSPYIP